MWLGWMKNLSQTLRASKVLSNQGGYGKEEEWNELRRESAWDQIQKPRVPSDHQLCRATG